MPVKRNAIGLNTCDVCRHWHNPEGQQMGLCMKGPPTPICVGTQPIAPSAIVDPSKPQKAMSMPIVLGFFAPRGPKDGCGACERDTAN
jgi:hypothetical protein